MPRAAFKRPLARADAEDAEDTDADDGAPRQIRHGIGQWPTRASAPPTASSSVFAAGLATVPCMDCALVGECNPPPWAMDKKPELLLRVAAHYGVDAHTADKGAEAAAVEPEEAAAA